jgi:hypothetical protein
MSKEEKPAVKIPVPVENSNLQAAVNQSVILPKDALAKANTTQTANDPAPNTSSLQVAAQQSLPLPKKPLVARESFDKSRDKS